MQTVQKLAKRHELPLEFTWNLESIYPDDALWETDFRAVKASIPRLEAFRGTLTDSGQQLLACLQLRDESYKLAEQVAAYARLRKDEDNTNSRYQALADRAMVLFSDLSGAASFITPEVLSIPDEKLQGFLASSPGLDLYRHYLEELLRQRPHVRSTEVEELLARAAEVARTPDSTYGMLTDADMKFPSIVDEEGRSVELSQSRYNQLRESQDRRVRRDAFVALHQTYSAYRNTLASSLAGGVRSDMFFARARNYPSALEAALDPNNIPPAVYHNLIQTVDRNLPLLHRSTSKKTSRFDISVVASRVRASSAWRRWSPVWAAKAREA